MTVQQIYDCKFRTTK